ncbi:MAG: hypothetical protein R3E39_01395 [Anaerolineae bacterium]
MAQRFYDSRHATTSGNGLARSSGDGKLMVLSDAGSVFSECSTARHAAIVTGRGRSRPNCYSGGVSGEIPFANTGGRIRPCASRVASQLNTLAPQAPEGWMQRLSPLHECGGAGVPPHSWTRQTASTERTHDWEAFPICITSVQSILVPICALQPNGNECKTGELQR